MDEIVRLHTDLEKEKRYEKVLETFQAVGLKDAKKVYDSYPHQLSGRHETAGDDRHGGDPASGSDHSR